MAGRLRIAGSAEEEHAAKLAAVDREARLGNHSIAQLCRRFNLTRGVVKPIVHQYKYGANQPSIKTPSNQARVPQPVVVSEPVVEPAPLPEPKTAAWALPNLNAVAMRAVGLILGGAGLALNYQYNSTLGQGHNADTMAAIGLGIDLIAIILVPAFFSLREKHHKLLAFFCAIIWFLCFIQSWNTGVKFSATNRDDARQARSDIIRQGNLLNSILETQKRARADLEKARTADIVEAEIQRVAKEVPPSNWKSSEECTKVTISQPYCGEVRALRVEKDSAMGAATKRERLDGIDKEIRETSEKIAALPSVAAEDPGANIVAYITWGRITPKMIDTFATMVTASMPSLAGFLFAFARKVSR